MKSNNTSSMMYTGKNNFVFSLCVSIFLYGHLLSDNSSLTSIDFKAARKKENIVHLAIIGSGPAGLTAALYGARAQLHTVVIEGAKPGGLLTDTTLVENWPGQQAIMGPELMDQMRAQVDKHGVLSIDASVEAVDFTQWPFKLELDDGTCLHALSVIIATGATPKMLTVPGEQKYWGGGVTSCAVCDAPFFKNEDVVVVGGGDSAIEEATYLASYARSVTVLVRKPHMRAARSMQQRLAGYDNIQVHYHTQVQSIEGDDDAVTHLLLYDNLRKTVNELQVTGVFLAIGHTPNTALFADAIALDDDGYVVTQGKTQQTSRDGVFVAGDCEDKIYRQAIVSAGRGAQAALEVVAFLAHIGLNDHQAEQLAPQLFDLEA